MKKRIAGFLIAAAAMMFAALPVCALTISIKPTDRFFINDFSGVISSADEEAIYAMGVQLYQKTGAQVVAVTVPSLDGADVDEYGLELGRAWGVGDDEADTGVVLLLATEDREVGIAVGYGLEGAITDARAGILLDTYGVPFFAEDDFSTGMKDTYAALINEVYLEFGMEADPDYTPVEELESDPLETWISLGVTVILLIVVFSSRGRLPWIFFLGGGHHRGGGGFSSGSNFGAFSGGGGSFGGGGASRRF